MEKDFSEVDIGTGNSESPGLALLERLKNIRKWQDEQCKELRERQFIREPQAKSHTGIESKVIMSDSTILECPVAAIPMTASNCRIEAVSGHSKRQNTTLEHLHVNPESPKIELRKSLMINESPCMSLSDFVHENHESLSSSSSTIVDSYPLPVSTLEIRSRDDLSCSHDGAYLRENEGLPFSQEVSPNSCNNQPISTSTDKRDMLLPLENVPKIKNVNDVSKETLLHSKVSIPKYETDDMRKLRGLSSFIKNHASKGGPSNNISYFTDIGASDSSELPAKPRFTFLRKGQGMSRFGMKPVKLKPKLCTDEIDLAKSSENLVEELTKNTDFVSAQKLITFNSSNVPPRTYQSKIANRPIQNLQLQKGSVKKDNLESHSEVRNSDQSEGKFGIPHTFSPVAGAYEKQGRKELEELSAFEKLEELAEDSSFSSNCSTVLQLLRRGQHSASSTPVRSRVPTPQLGNFRTEESGNHSSFEEVIQRDFPLVSVSQILEQLRGIVRLDHADEPQVSENELRTLIESFVDSDTSLPSEYISYFANNIKHLTTTNATSTPALLPPFPAKLRVHFRPEGVEVLEYECSDTEEENTLTDAPSIVDDTDLVTTSDLEILASYDAQPNIQDIDSGQKPLSNRVQVLSNVDIAPVDDDTPRILKISTKEKNKESLQPLKLQFSPPPQRPQNSASHYIWSIFGKDKARVNDPKQKTVKNESGKTDNHSCKTEKDVSVKATTEKSSNQIEKCEGTQDVDSYKALLMAKVYELERETESFKKENRKLKSLQETLQSEKDKLEKERQTFRLEVDHEKKKFREYVDLERNKLWKEKQGVKTQSPTALSVREQSLEIVYLKEQLHDVEENAKKRESLHTFMEKKNNEKIRAQEEEIKALKEKNLQLQTVEKQNMFLKHELDRAKLSGKILAKNKTKVCAPGHAKLKTKRTTINSINKSLDTIGVGDIITDKIGPRTQPEKPVIRSPGKSRTANIENRQENQEIHYEKHQQKIPSLRIALREVVPEDNVNKNILPDIPENVISDEEDEGSLRERHMELKNSGTPLGSSLSIDCTELCRDDGTKEIIYANGNKKEIYPDGTTIVYYYNGDKKEIYNDRTVYVYGTDSTRHTTYSNGKETLEFPNGQKETRYSDGSSEIIFTDNTRKKVMPDGTEICVMKDGTVVRTNSDGVRVFEFASGQKEVHTPEEKRREYPDGTVKILHQDGRTETRYKTGRVRVKDKEGNILIDTHLSVQ